MIIPHPSPLPNPVPLSSNAIDRPESESSLVEYQSVSNGACVIFGSLWNAYRPVEKAMKESGNMLR